MYHQQNLSSAQEAVTAAISHPVFDGPLSFYTVVPTTNTSRHCGQNFVPKALVCFQPRLWQLSSGWFLTTLRLPLMGTHTGLTPDSHRTHTGLTPDSNRTQIGLTSDSHWFLTTLRLRLMGTQAAAFFLSRTTLETLEAGTVQTKISLVEAT